MDDGSQSSFPAILLLITRLLLPNPFYEVPYLYEEALWSTPSPVGGGDLMRPPGTPSTQRPQFTEGNVPSRPPSSTTTTPLQ